MAEAYHWSTKLHALRRPIADPKDAERFAAEILRALGFPDAQPTPTGPDAGVDVVARDMVAQVKHQLTPVGRPELQRLVGASSGRRTIFFSSAGYSRQAVQFADTNEMALLVYSVMGDVAAANPSGEVLVEVGNKDFSEEQLRIIQRNADLNARCLGLVEELQRLQNLAFPNKAERKALKALVADWDRLTMAAEDVERLLHHIPDEEHESEQLLQRVLAAMDKVESILSRLEAVVDIRY